MLLFAEAHVGLTADVDFQNLPRWQINILDSKSMGPTQNEQRGHFYLLGPKRTNNSFGDDGGDDDRHLKQSSIIMTCMIKEKCHFN